MSVQKIPMRDGYGKALLELIAANPNVIALDADVAKSTRSIWVKEKFPANFVDMGIAEQDLVGTAAGLALWQVAHGTKSERPFATTTLTSKSPVLTRVFQSVPTAQLIRLWKMSP